MQTNKVNTTNRCEALKEVMSLNYGQYYYMQIKNISDILKCFVNDTSKTFDIIDRLERPEIFELSEICVKGYRFSIFILR